MIWHWLVPQLLHGQPWCSLSCLRFTSSCDQIFGAFSGGRRGSFAGKWLLPTGSKDLSFPSASRDFCSIYIASGTHTRWLRANEEIIDHASKRQTSLDSWRELSAREDRRPSDGRSRRAGRSFGASIIQSTTETSGSNHAAPDHFVIVLVGVASSNLPPLRTRERASHRACTPKGARPFRRRRRRHKLRVRVADTAAHTQKHRLGSRHGNQLADSCACSAAVGERASSSSAGSPFHATPIHKGLAPRQ